MPPHLAIDGPYACRWKVFVEKPGRMRVDASYAAPDGEALGTLRVEAAASVLEHVVEPTGLTVGEPNQDWHSAHFTSHPLGSVEFGEAGVHDVTLRVEAGTDGPLQLQWLWLAPESMQP